LLLKTAAETLITIAADPKHLGARIGLTAVLHTWGSALAHHPHAQSSSPTAASLPMVSPGLPAGTAPFCPSGAYPTRRRQAGTATAPKILTNTASGTLVLAAAAHDHNRDLRTRLPAAAVDHPLSPVTGRRPKTLNTSRR